MALLGQLLAICLLVHVAGLNTGRIARCEHAALLLGSNMADIFNLPIGNQNWDERVHQDHIVENLGFAPWTVNGYHRSGGKTLTRHNAKDISQLSGWSGRSIDKSPYDILSHKWIYQLGDSTTRQIWASFAAPFQGNNFERNAKEWSRQYCNKQTHRVNHPKGGNFPNEGWHGPCGVNEITCYVSGYGDEGLLTFDWKHFPYEDYDDFLWGEKGPWNSNEAERRPDILTVQLGLHSCWHSHPEGMYSQHLTQINQSMVDSHINDIPKLMSAIYKAVNRANNRTSTTVVVMTSGASWSEGGPRIDDCILRFNRALEVAAHAVGFAVLERGEIERRLMFKSFRAERPYLTAEIHLPQPAQNIVSTCLLRLLQCLANTNDTLPEDVYLGTDTALAPPPPARPLHTPP